MQSLTIRSRGVVVFPAALAAAEILTQDEKRYSTTIDYPIGDPENPLSWEAMVERFHDLAGQILKKDQRLKIIDAVKRLDGAKDLREWSRQFLRKA